MRLPFRPSLLAASLLCAVATPAMSSGGESLYVSRFASQFQPARLPDYAAGNLGVVQGSYWRLYQFMAFKAATGKPLTAQQLAALTPHGWRVGPNAGFDYIENSETNGTAEWLAKRQKYAALLKLPEQVDVGYLDDAGDFESYINCNADAFKQAAATLEARAGAKPDAWTAQWILGQDAVFSNCAGKANGAGKAPSKPVVQLPPPLPKGAPESLVWDHAYQSAAANFYARNLDAARVQFQAIAQQGKSPWRTLGGYLAARTLIRKATLEFPKRADEPAKPERTALLTQARQEMAALSTTYAPARRMMALIDARLDPAQRIATLARLLDKDGFNAETPGLLSDYLTLLDTQEWMKMALAKEPLTAWIGNMQTPAGSASDEEPDARALAMKTMRQSWLKQPDALWLAPLLKLAHAGELSDAERKAAAAVAPAHPLYLTLQYHLTRIDLEEKHAEQADRNLDRLTAAYGKKMSVATSNRFRALKMGSAGSLDGFMQAALRRPETIGEPDDTTPEPLQAAAVDEDFGRTVLRSFSMSQLKAVLQHPALPPDWKTKLEETLFTRALIFKDEPTALSLLGAMAKNRKSTAHLYARYRKAASGAARDVVAKIILINTPELQPAVLGSDNMVRYWGCANAGGKFMMYEVGASAPFAPRFLSKEQVAEADREYQKMMALPLRTEYVAPVLLEWAGVKRDDQEAPKALHYLVASTRMECPYGTDKPEKEQLRTRYSRAAFELLKKKYGDSDWAQSTKYFY